jgi:hypothetical protein
MMGNLWIWITNLNISQSKDLAALFQSLVMAASFIVGGVWVYRRYIFQQENFAHIESATDIILIGEHSDYWVIELVGILENKGKVEHKIENFNFDAVTV